MSHNNTRNAKIGIFVLFLQSATRNVMNLGFRQIFTILSALLLSIIVPAQDLPVLPEDSAVLKGVMPNGMTYYLVTNPTVKGEADFALVQRTGRTIGDEAVTTARDALSSLKRVVSSTPGEFLARHEVSPGRNGFVCVTDDATVYRFSNLRLSGGNVIDSTLLVIMDITDRVNYAGNDFMRKWYTPADQAVIVSGDIDAKSVASKLNSMSYMIPSGVSQAREEYSGKENGMSVFIETAQRDSALAEVSATWTSKRAPRKYMNTIQPEIFEMTLNTLGVSAVGRIRKTLESADIPVADVSYGHICSSSYPYDDSFTVSVTVEAKNAPRALEAIAGVMASIDASGVGKDEYLVAESAYVQELADEASYPVRSNREYVDRCVNAFLYNSSLASAKERLAFHTSRNLPDTLRQRLFNDIAQAVLDGSRNLTVGFPGDTLLARAAFDSVWTAFSSAPRSFAFSSLADTLDFPGPGAKVKLKSSKKEHVSGGSIWTFSNGFKVIYKKMASDRMYYILALNGGYSSMSGMASGEGAFLSDYFGTCRINGMKAEEFINLLQEAGIVMDLKVSMSNMMVSGSLKEDRMNLLMRSLLAVANQRTPDEEAFDYYKKSEYLALDLAQGSFASRMSAIDDIMCPDYRYSPYKQKGRLSAGFRDKAEGYFKDRFSSMNDGALVLVGNMDEEKLKKLLTTYVGDFRTTDVAFRRPVVRYQPVSGWSTYTVNGNVDNVDVAMSARMPLTMENYIAATLASMVLKRNLAKEFDDAGMYINLNYNCRIYPEERFNLLISVSEASEDGFPSGMKPKTPIEVLTDVRSVLSGLHLMKITDNDLKPYKEALKNRIAHEMKSPSFWAEAIALRYLDGKDLTTDYAAKIDAVTSDRVMSTLTLLNDGSKVEYVTIRK